MFNEEGRLNQASSSHKSEMLVVSQALKVSSEKSFRKDPGQVTEQPVREASIVH